MTATTVAGSVRAPQSQDRPAGWTATEIRELCRALRGALAGGDAPTGVGLPASGAAVPAPLLRRWLIAVADEAVRCDGLSCRARDAWVAAEGLTARCRPRSGIAAALGVSPSRLDQLRTEATRAVAAAANSGAVPVPSEPGAELPTEWALAQVHAEVAIAEPADPAAAEAVRALRHRIIDELPRSQPHPPASDAERAARSRSRRALEARLNQQRLAPVRLPLRLLARGGAAADPAELAELAHRAEQARVTDPAASRQLSERAVRGYASFEVPPDPQTEARAWWLAAYHDMHGRDMAAVWRAQRVARLLGPAHPLAVESLAGAAAVLRANGYLGASDRMACRLLRDMPGVAATTVERERLTGVLLAVFGAATPWSAGGTPPAGALDAATIRGRQHQQLLETGTRTPSRDEWLTAQRRALLAESAAAAAAARAEGARRPAWPDAFRRRVLALVDDSAGASAESRVFTALTLTRLCAERGDRDGFAAAFADFLSIWRTELPTYDFHAEEHGFRSRAERARWAGVLAA